MNSARAHAGRLELGRIAAGEPVDPGLARHVEGCPQCQGRLDELAREQRGFEQAIDFERFERGVHAARRRHEAERRGARWSRVSAVGLALAAGLVLAIGVSVDPRTPMSRTKGGAGVEIIVAAEHGPQRVARTDGVEPLASGERVRIGVVPGAWHFVAVLSIDEAGAVTPVYDAHGKSVALSGASPEFLPDSLELTGQGLERLTIVLSDRALDVDVAAFELRRRYEAAGGDLTRLQALDVAGEQFHVVFRKP